MTAAHTTIDAIRIAATAADRLKASDIVAFDVTDLLAFTEVMMIASASNERQVLAIAEEVEKDLYLKTKRSPRSREGLTEGQWILLDYGDFVIHIMHQESRDYYGLERLWRDQPTIDLELEHPEES
ncbi:ribosome silencing factor [uncultured Bifidobacterium sp.]|uniref:ribosome silencing factor n=1 Tax=uncultured Bifidobacterium sp. TaxID=165187 RepID=UPI00259AC704|nr:ribosome silencing factor [uncultured Bifidobacterium sp.]